MSKRHHSKPLSEQEKLIRALKRSTLRTIVVSTHHKPNIFYEDNPNDTGTFKGTDGRWYKFVVDKYQGNCYAFALGTFYNAPHTGYYIPGFLENKVPHSINEYVDLIKEDLAALDRRVHEVIFSDDIPEQLPKAAPNTYWVKVMFKVDGYNHFHFARLDELSGRWIHIVGWENPPKVLMRNLEHEDVFYKTQKQLIDDGIIDTCGMTEKQFIEKAREFANFRGICTLPSVTKSKYETDAKASYFLYAPETEPNNFQEYKTFCVMRIDY